MKTTLISNTMYGKLFFIFYILKKKTHNVRVTCRRMRYPLRVHSCHLNVLNAIFTSAGNVEK